MRFMVDYETFRRIFIAGFDVSRQGFNAEYAGEHLAPQHYSPDGDHRAEHGFGRSVDSWDALDRLCREAYAALVTSQPGIYTRELTAEETNTDVIVTRVQD